MSAATWRGAEVESVMLTIHCYILIQIMSDIYIIHSIYPTLVALAAAVLCVVLSVVVVVVVVVAILG